MEICLLDGGKKDLGSAATACVLCFLVLYLWHFFEVSWVTVLAVHVLVVEIPGFRD